MTGIAVAACGKSDKSSETEADEENAELQTIEFDTGAEEPVETAQIPEPVEEVPVIEETPVTEETLVSEEPAPAETVEEPEPAETKTSSDYSIEDISEITLFTTETVNMRTGPSASDFDVAEKLSPGTQVTANGKVNGYKGDGKSWYRIKKGDGSSGYFIIADYLSDKKPEKKEETADNSGASDNAAKKAADDAAKKAAEDAAKKAAEDAANQAAETPTTVTPAPAAPAVPAGDQPKNGHKYPDSKIAADWDRTGANSAGKKWSELDEGTKEALRIHYDDHGCSGW